MKILIFGITCWLTFQRAPAAPDNKGTEFIMAFGENFPNNYPLELFIATDSENVTVHISVPRMSETYATQTVSVSRGNTARVELSENLRMLGKGYQDKGVLIQSSDEVVIYATNKAAKSADAFLVLPTDVVGTLYYVPSYPNAPFSAVGPQLGVIATENNTTVTLTMPASRSVGQWYQKEDGSAVNDGDSHTIILDAYQAYQLQIEQDLTGAKVESNHPVAVVSGNKRTYIIKDDSSDHIEEMIPPVNTWGRKFITVPFAERTGGDLFRIIGSRSNITVSVTSTTTGATTSYLLVDPGDFKELDVASTEHLFVEADGAVFVCQYSKTSAVDGAESDPMMMYVPPMEQFDTEYTFSTVDAVSAPYTNYINVVIKTQYIEGIRIDEQAINISHAFDGSIANFSQWIKNWTPVANTGYSANTLFVPHGTHVLDHTSPVTTFAAFMYGQVIYESYGYPAGSRLSSIGDSCVTSNMTISDGVDNDCDGSTDEEFMNGVDDDGDGSIDEDAVHSQVLPTEPPTTTTEALKMTTTETSLVRTTEAATKEISTSTTTETSKTTTADVPTVTNTEVPTMTTTEAPTGTNTEVQMSTTTEAPTRTTAEESTTITTEVSTKESPTGTTTEVPTGTNTEVQMSATTDTPTRATAEAPTAITAEVSVDTTPGAQNGTVTSSVTITTEATTEEINLTTIKETALNSTESIKTLFESTTTTNSSKSTAGNVGDFDHQNGVDIPLIVGTTVPAALLALATCCCCFIIVIIKRKKRRRKVKNDLIDDENIIHARNGATSLSTHNISTPRP